MASTLGWLDTDEHQRKTMLQVVDAFRERDTLDELGIGAVRDGISEILFPGVSTIQSRARYLLFVPWIYARIAAEGLSGDRAIARGRRDEVRLIDALLAGGETDGVIGRFARSNLQRLPSVVYWSALGRYGIRSVAWSLEGYCRAGVGARMRDLPGPDGGDQVDRSEALGWRRLPPRPDRLLERATFELSASEASYLRERVTTAVPTSLLRSLLDQPDAQWAAAVYPWETDLHSLPDHLATVIEHTRRFAILLHGAVLLYNLILAEQVRNDGWIEYYRTWLGEWAQEIVDGRLCAGWNHDEFWSTVREGNPRIERLTRHFVQSWVDRVCVDPGAVADSAAARSLVTERERQVKRTRARIDDPRTQDRWNGQSGIARLDFRWSVGSTIAADIVRGLQES